ncbi:helix-turn-helix domain-containing protein [Collimonas sp.]|jgi:HTH-type transcriptional regulator/antitoxin HigA|uniref:helix-turn-helix domain-containing protein n=1 Tax=Collimonas sp. TaxID=1963772 RepID=UPI002BFFEDED|nr:helix-turn-helix domain-containing protein [Collimonas sp.]HWX04145.1 helix-turn-helix domain-containing protein [Collimonas sp.]
MNAVTLDASAIAPVWKTFQDALPVRIGIIRDDAQYDQMVGFMNGLLDVVGDDEEHELMEFLDLVSQLVSDYESTRYVMPGAKPHEVLRFIMEQHGLKQTDLAAEIGGQSVVSDILGGKREINARQARALAARFGVSPAVFL